MTLFESESVDVKVTKDHKGNKLFFFSFLDQFYVCVCAYVSVHAHTHFGVLTHVPL